MTHFEGCLWGKDEKGYFLEKEGIILISTEMAIVPQSVQKVDQMAVRGNILDQNEMLVFVGY